MDAWHGMDVWQHGDLLVQRGELVVDRPRGTSHPAFADFVYPLDYGFIAGTRGGDGEGVDVWLGTGPAEQITAIACTVDPFRRNAELKLLWRCTPTQIHLVEDFYAPQPQACLMVRRPN